MSDAIRKIAQSLEVQARIAKTMDLFNDPYQEEGVIADVNDPKKLGRVKVITSDNLVSHWIGVQGSNSGTLSSRYIGARVLLSKINGRSENMYVVGFINNTAESGISGTPLQLAFIDESTEVWNSTTDSGMKCNQGNRGRMYILSNEMNQDVVVCLRRNNTQTGSEPSWAWKSITNGLWVEKGINPGNSEELFITQAQERNPGIPDCNETVLGEVHDFTEDRKFRTTTLQCRRDENGGFTWMPLSSPPVFFKTTLPKCEEKTHGMEAVLDDGNNSEFLVCQRYQGIMRWAKQGRRIVHKFYPLDKPVTKQEFLNTFNPIAALEEQASDEEPKGYDWVSGDKNIALAVIDKVMSFIPLTNTDPELKKLLELANLIPAGAFNGSDVLQQAANEAVSRKSGFPISTLISQIRDDLDGYGEVQPALNQVLKGLGEAGTVLLEGSRLGTNDEALTRIGRDTFINSLSILQPESVSVLSGMMAGGIWGAIDTATALGLDRLPPDTSKYIRPIIEIGKEIFEKYPDVLGKMLNSSVDGGLKNLVSEELNKLIGKNLVSPQLISGVGNLLTSGSLGEVGKLFNSVSNLREVTNTFGGLPFLASTLAGSLGVESSVASLIGVGAGIGLEGLAALLGESVSPTSLILSGISGLSTLLGGFKPSGGCPCDPKCRKIKHGNDSDGLKLLEKCGALTRNNANAYSPAGFPIPNNVGDVAKSQGLLPTGVGKELIPVNPRNFPAMVSTIKRVKEMAESFYASRNADDAEKEAELAYTFEAVEKSAKVIANNVSRIQSVDKNLIDSTYNLLREIIDKPGGAVLANLIIDARENAQAIKDLYAFVKTLDKVKKGGTAKVRVTSSIQKSFDNIQGLKKLSEKNKAEAEKILSSGISQAYSDWSSMTDSDSALGAFMSTMPDPFPSEKTLFDEPRVIAISLEAKITESEENEVQESILTPEQIETLKTSYFNRQSGNYEKLTGEQEPSVYEKVIARKGQTNCE